MKRLLITMMLSLTLVAPDGVSAQGPNLTKIIEQAAKKGANQVKKANKKVNQAEKGVARAEAKAEKTANKKNANAKQNAKAEKRLAKAQAALAAAKQKLADTLARISKKVDNEVLKKFKKAKNKKIDSVNAEVETVRVIIRPQPGSKSNLARLSSLGANIKGGVNKFKLFDGIVVEVPADLLDTLADHFAVASVHLDADIELSQNGNGAGNGQSNNGNGSTATGGNLPGELATVTGALEAAQAYGVTGAGIGIAVIDSGIDDDHIDLPNVVHTEDFTTNASQNGVNNRRDGFGHGTHVAGIIAGNGMASGGQYAGMAPGAHLIDLKVLKNNGGGSASDVIEAIEWALLNRDQYNIRILNLSLGHMPYESADTDPLTLMVRAAVDAGIVVVVSSGNAGRIEGEIVYGGVTSPGTEASALTVGAMTTWDTPSRADDTVAGYSSRGPTRFEELIKPDIAAPGTQIVAPRGDKNDLAKNYPQVVVDDNYMWLSGTSMAAPVVSGAVALMLEQNPYLTPNQVKAILMYTAEAGKGNPFEVGAGYMNAAGAVNLAANVDATTAVGDYWLLNNGVGLDYSNVIAGFPAVWAETIVWGKGLYSVDGFDYNETSYSETIVWGKTIVWDEVEGETITWGKTIAWDEVDAETITWGKTITWDDF